MVRYIKTKIREKLKEAMGEKEKINKENTHLFKKVGSNFKILNRTVFFEPRGAWKTLSDSGFFGGNSEQTALRADHIFASEPDFVFWRRHIHSRGYAP